MAKVVRKSRIVIHNSQMNEAPHLKIYIRRTNGTGDKLTVNPMVSCKHLYTFISHILNLGEKTFDLYHKGSKIADTAELPVSELGLQSEAIVHVHERGQGEQDGNIELRVFYQGSVYSYRTDRMVTFREFKGEIVNMLGCQVRDVTVSFLGREVDDEDTLESWSIKDRDFVSVVVNPSWRFSPRSASWLKPKMTQSMTFANTDQQDPNQVPFSTQKLRKSSMKSSHQSRQLKLSQTKKLLQVIRPKSELTKSNNSQEAPQQEQNIEMNNLAWLSNQKVIETQSINLDEEEVEDGPQMWDDCQVELWSRDRRRFYVLDCGEGHGLADVLRVISRCEGRQGGTIGIVFADENSQSMADSGATMLQIAKAAGTKIIKQAIIEN